MILGDVLPPVDNKGGGLPFFWSFHTGESLRDFGKCYSTFSDYEMVTIVFGSVWSDHNCDNQEFNQFQVGTHTSPSIHKFLYTPSVRDPRDQQQRPASGLRDRADADVERRHIVSNLNHHQEMDFRLHLKLKYMMFAAISIIISNHVDTGGNILYLQAVSRWSDLATGVQRLDQVKSRDHHLSRLCMFVQLTSLFTHYESKETIISLDHVCAA